MCINLEVFNKVFLHCNPYTHIVYHAPTTLLLILIFDALTQLLPERTRTHDRLKAAQGLIHSAIAEAAYISPHQYDIII